MMRSAKKQANGAVVSNGHAISPKPDQKTNYTRWRLLDEHGRHTWHYLKSDEELKSWPQSCADKHFLGLPTVSDWSELFEQSALLILLGSTLSFTCFQALGGHR